MTTATIYLRQSQDKTGEAAAVSRQLAECRAFCEGKGWTVDEVFTDNDISATSGRRRPGFEALLASNPKRIVVWHIDRLVRLSRELERVIDLGVNVHAVKSGHIDLSNPAGRATAKTITAWAQYEGEQKSTRQVSANRQKAQRGVVSWSRRPFGFDRDGETVRLVKAEAAEIRKAAKAVLSGATLQSVVDDLNRRGVQTSTGGRWTVTTIRRAMLSPRVAGRVVYRGEDMGMRAPAILDADTADRLAALLKDPRRRTAPSVRTKHLMSGLVRCGLDGDVMFATTNTNGKGVRRMVYKCRSCTRARTIGPVDEVVMGALVARLSRPDAAGLLDRDVDLDALREQVDELRKRRDGLASLLAEGLLTTDAVRGEAKRLTDQIEGLSRQIRGAEDSSPLARVAGAEDVAAALEGLSLLDLREVIRTLMTVRILPVGKGARFDPEHVQIVWKGQQ